MLINWIHGWMIRLMYRVLAPGHPRGTTDMHAVHEDACGETLWLHTHGLRRHGLSEIELSGVPVALKGYAHGFLFEIMGYMKSQKPISADEDVGGAFYGDSQRVYHAATARLVQRTNDSQHDGYLRFVDKGETADSGFPSKLFATHLAAAADDAKEPGKAESLARQSLALWDGSADDSRTMEFNRGNWLAWDILGHSLCYQGKIDEGLDCFRTMARNCPDAVRRTREIILEMAKDLQQPPDSEVSTQFFLNFDSKSPN